MTIEAFTALPLSSEARRFSTVNSPDFQNARLKAALDKKRIIEQKGLCLSEFSRLFYSVSIKTGEFYDVNCRSWRCPKHRLQWGTKWGVTIGEMLKQSGATLLVNLTTAEMIDNESIVAATRFFMKRFRDYFGPTEYVRVVEYNKSKTQPHFHLILRCDNLKIAKMPWSYTHKEGRKKSWPYSVWTVIKYFWTEALCYAAPWARLTTVVWCQPPGNVAAASKYAVNYITGKDKDEEPDSTWKGRKLSYSRSFFDVSPQIIWQMFLDWTFGERDPEDMFCWTPKNDPKQQLETDDLGKFASNVTMKERYKLFKYYSYYGKFPPTKQPEKSLLDLYFEMGEDGQEYFVPELEE